MDSEGLYDDIPAAREMVEKGLREAITLNLKEARNYLVLRKGLDQRSEVGALFFADSLMIAYTPLSFDEHPFEAKYAARAALALQSESKAVDGCILYEYCLIKGKELSRQARRELAESLQVFGVKVLDYILFPHKQKLQEVVKSEYVASATA